MFAGRIVVQVKLVRADHRVLDVIGACLQPPTPTTVADPAIRPDELDALADLSLKQAASAIASPTITHRRRMPIGYADRADTPETRRRSSNSANESKRCFASWSRG